MSDHHTPPRLTRWLISLLLPRDAHEIVSGDLSETFADEVTRHGASRARRRYRRLALQSIAEYWRPAPRIPHANHSTASTGTHMTSSLARDLRLGLRQVLHRPGFSFGVAATLAVGIAATTIVYGLVSALTMNPLSYSEPDRVVFLLGWDTRADRMRFQIRYTDAVDIAARTDVLDDVAMYRAWDANLQGSGLPERATAYRVTGNTFDLLGTRAELGRTFSTADLASGNDRLAVLSHALWVRRYGADPGIVGREIVINSAQYAVLGVMPATFEFPVFNFKGDLWTPLTVTPEWTPANRGRSPSVVAIGRLADHVSADAAQVAATTVMSQIAEASPDTNLGRGVRITGMADLGTEQITPAFAVLIVTVGLVLVVACANAANLQLARGVTRSREMALRAALGASRFQLIRQLLAESAVLAFIGGGLGIALAWVGLDGVRHAVPEFFARVLPGIASIRLDPSVLAVALLTSVATVFIFGLVPAWRTIRVALTDALKSGNQSVTAPHREWLRSGLIVGEVALSVALLVATGLLARSVHNLTTADPGFAKDRLLTFSASLPPTLFDEPATRQRYFDSLLRDIQAVPGVTEVGLVNTLPFSTSDETVTLSIEGVPSPVDTERRSGFRLVNDRYFDALGVQLIDGRGLRPSDGVDAVPSVVVNQAFVRAYLSDLPALGRTVRLGSRESEATIVGVVSDVQHGVLSTAPEPEIYLHFSQEPRTTMSLAVRTDGEPMSLLPTIRATAAALDPSVPLYDAAPMSRLVDNSFIAQDLASSALVVFGLSTLVLTSLGLHGLLAFAVGTRAKEIGVRMALGASRRAVMALVLRHSVQLAGLGILVGLGLAFAVSRGLESLLFGVEPGDPISYAAAALVIVVVALVASWLPARRAMGVDPIDTLRS